MREKLSEFVFSVDGEETMSKSQGVGKEVLWVLKEEGEFLRGTVFCGNGAWWVVVVWSAVGLAEALGGLMSLGLSLRGTCKLVVADCSEVWSKLCFGIILVVVIRVLGWVFFRRDEVDPMLGF